MASSFEKSVKGATKIKLAPPKSKYIEHILIATHSGDHGVAEVFRILQNRLRDSTWTVVFKSLIVIHLMIREGEPDVTLRYLSDNPRNKLAISNFTEVQTQGRNIRSYSEYLRKRAQAFQQTKVDYVKNGEGRLKRLTIDKGLLRETETVQDQIRGLLKCDFLTDEPENEITLFAFRLLTMDLLALFHVMNEGIINVLEHYFEMSKVDAERAIAIYRMFTKLTDHVVQYLAVARHYEHVTRFQIPKIKHAPITLASSLEEYLHDKDFEINRRQYLAQQDARKRTGKGGSANGIRAFTEKASTPTKTTTTQKFPSPKQSAAQPAKTETKGPAPDLIDFFESIEQNQQPLAQPEPQFHFAGQQFPQQGFAGQPTGFISQPPGFPQQQPQAFATAQGTNPFGQPQPQPQPQPQVQQPAQLQTNFTGAGFGGYTPQPQQSFNSSLSSIPQEGVATFSPQQQTPSQTGSTNPFRQSMMPQATGTSLGSLGSGNPMSPSSGRLSTNPFARNSPTISTTPFDPPNAQPQQQTAPFQPQSQFGQAQQAQQNSSPFGATQPQPTGTNPFARNASPNMPPGGQPTGNSTLSPVASNATGSTNPFRQSAFVNQSTGQGWQNVPQNQGTIGGFGVGGVDTTPIFPRPGAN
ncbi:ANTH-domain-containing protein [Rhizodiscina lignyota]|uniref:ANTH-domain-containing protein n=1 Tax=Rhizodiscina lignyota TaxID=1504668 RepID=A0A9P4IP24_9PEZI|nr:ANTH-domain-containing protein [Rhizodiscina lignyota]